MHDVYIHSLNGLFNNFEKKETNLQLQRTLNVKKVLISHTGLEVASLVGNPVHKDR